jgi:hypothetical protein
MSSRSQFGAFCVAALVLAAAGCSRGGRPSSSDSAAGAVAAGSSESSRAIPPAIEQVGAHGEALYDAATVGDWRTATASLDSLRTAVAQLPSDVASDTRATLTALADSLSRDIQSRQQLQAQMDANRVTYVSVDLLRPYAPTTPVQIVLMDYLGRELEIGAARNDAAKLAQTSKAIRRTWAEVRPQIASRDPAQAMHTEALVARIEKTRTPADVRRVATPFLDEVDLLEKVFPNR